MSKKKKKKSDEVIPVAAEIAVSDDLTRVDLIFICDYPMSGESFIECVSNFLIESKDDIREALETDLKDLNLH